MAAAVIPDEVAPPTAAVQAGPPNDEWCRDTERDDDDDDRVTFCEVREFTLPSGSVSANTSNGSIRVTGERRSDILVRARVATYARTAARAREIARDVTIERAPRISVDGPRAMNREGWHVSFRVQAPESTNVEFTTSNGSLAATGIRGQLRLRTSNGSIALTDVAGDVQAETSNGSVNATLSGTRWDGEGLDISTSNGSVRLGVPENYNARIIASTSNGSLNFGFPITVSGNLGGRRRDVDTTIGSGGPTIRLRTSNGSVRVGRPGEVERGRRVR